VRDAGGKGGGVMPEPAVRHRTEFKTPTTRRTTNAGAAAVQQ
jgi:hypothetical protein